MNIFEAIRKIKKDHSERFITKIDGANYRLDWDKYEGFCLYREPSTMTEAGVFFDIPFEILGLFEHADFKTEPDWSKIPVDTKVYFSDCDVDEKYWEKGYFKMYVEKDNGKRPFGIFSDGKTSWSTDSVTFHKYCKLAEGEGK